MRNRSMLKWGLIIILIFSLCGALIQINLLQIIVAVISFILYFYYFCWKPILSKIIKKEFPQDCPFTAKNECPYANIKLCPYDKRNCLKDEISKQSRSFFRGTEFLFIITIISIIVIIFSNIYQRQGTPFKLDELVSWPIFFSTLNSLSISLLAGIVITFILDIPGRMKEYKNYFIELLSSTDYLKLMDEKKLLDLRKKITLLLHAKDVPNMPKGLIKLDEKICEMLSFPYFKEYKQTVVVTQSESKNNEKLYGKENKIEYTVFNPYDSGHSTIMDLGFSNCCMLVAAEEDALLCQIKRTFILKKYTIQIDNSPEEINLLGYVKMYCKETSNDELSYTAKIILSGKDKGKLPEDPLDTAYFSKKKPIGTDRNDIYEILTEDLDESKIGLFVKFADKLIVKFEYQIYVPETDLVFTKRLRYPVKYFHLDYISKVNEISLRGQLIGTLIEQSEISTVLSTDKKHLCLRTHDWLLPKNGVVVVMIPNK